MLSIFINFFLVISHKIGYLGILLLMTIESSFIPFPSEVIIPPAAYLAQKGEFNIYLVVFFGILGSLIGALINYYLAYFLGRKIVYSLVDKKIFKIVMLNSKKIEKSEKFFLKYGNESTLIGRLVPIIRQLISLPAGFSKMKLKNFIFYTSIGSGIWTIILAFLGYYLGANKNLLEKYFKEIEILFLVVGLAAFIYLLTIFFLKGKKNKNE